MIPNPGLQPGLIVANYGRHFLVETASGDRVICHSRGKKSQGVVGDRVHWLASKDEGTIEQIKERSNLFFRRDEVRTKAFAANLDQILILLAAEPVYSSMQLARALIAAEAQNIRPIIALNKSDLTTSFERAWTWLRPYEAMDYEVLRLCLRHGIPNDFQASGSANAGHGVAQSETDRLISLLKGKTTLVLGPSGTGKSTLINLLAPGAMAETQEISSALNSGKHTTTSTSWYWVDMAELGQRTAVIDSPGFQEFGLHHIDPMQLAAYMPDIKPHASNCKFYNCTHIHEPGCSVIANLKSASRPHGIDELRYKIYSEIFSELSAIRRY